MAEGMTQDLDQLQRAGQVWRPDTTTTPPEPGGESAPPPPDAGTSAVDGGVSGEPAGVGDNLSRAQQINLRRYGDVGGPKSIPPPPAVPVPPPPVQFNVAGAGGGEGASSFARPGSAAARPFRSMNFVNSRLSGGSPMEMGGRRVGFGAGSAVVGGAGAPTGPGSPFSSAEGEQGSTDPDEIGRILAQIAGRYQ